MDHVIGQSRAHVILTDQLKYDHVHHAQLFHGPAGVGKRTMALAFAQVLLCHEADGANACGTCDSCVKFHGMRQLDALDPVALPHPDLHMVVKELARSSEDSAVRARKMTTIPVAVLHEFLLEPAMLSPTLGHGKVFVVDEAELMDQSGQNLILKTLEEPPSGTVILLLTEQVDRMLPTVRSRCQRVPFAELPDEILSDLMCAHLPPLDQSTHEWLQWAARGSVGRARQMHDWGVTSWRFNCLKDFEDVMSGQPKPGLGASFHASLEDIVKTLDEKAGIGKEAAGRRAFELLLHLVGMYTSRAIGQHAGTGEVMLAPWVHVAEALSDVMAFRRANVNLSHCCGYLASVIHQSAIRQVL